MPLKSMFDNPWAYRLSMRPSYISSLKNTTDVSVRFSNCECFLNLLLIMFFHRAPLSISFTLCIENICLKLLCEYYILNSDASILTNSSITFVRYSPKMRPFWDIFCCSQSAVTGKKELQSTYFQVLSCWGKIARQFHGSATSWLYRVVVLKWFSIKKLCYELCYVNL